jgi:hypothetical protein
MDDITYSPDMSAEERLKAWEREKKGLITDLQAEREKRQAMEQRIAGLETRLVPLDSVGQSAEDKVNRLAQNPDAYIDERVNTRVSKVEEELKRERFQSAVNEAYDWLADQEGTTRRKIINSDLDKDMARIIKENSLGNLDPRQGIVAAHKIYLQEKTEKENAEKTRSAAINGNSTEKPQRSTPVGGMRFTAKQIASMSMDEFNRNFDAIQEAKKNGLISTT